MVLTPSTLYSSWLCHWLSTGHLYQGLGDSLPSAAASTKRRRLLYNPEGAPQARVTDVKDTRRPSAHLSGLCACSLATCSMLPSAAFFLCTCSSIPPNLLLPPPSSASFCISLLDQVRKAHSEYRNLVLPLQGSAFPIQKFARTTDEVGSCTQGIRCDNEFAQAAAAVVDIYALDPINGQDG